MSGRELKKDFMKMRGDFRLKKILVPVDFSEPSRKALHYAISLAKPFKAEILLVHVVESVLPPPDAVIVESAALAAALNKEAAKRLSEWRKKAASLAPVREILLTGAPYREIVDFADQSKADLIVLGTHGRTGLTRLLIGSTAERVMRHAPCPVLVVREREHEARAASKRSTA
ncbi:MAG: putative universal stress protein [Pedosphaera sp.]|nr:putative universal stress protein [Pedosphaera sp.]